MKSSEVQIAEEACISPEMTEVYRQKTPTERLQIAFGMWRSARRIVSAAVRHQLPNLSDEQQQQEVARRMSDGLV
jgi:SMC interacting uncharacterized protein involved in chromosome segregation